MEKLTLLSLIGAAVLVHMSRGQEITRCAYSASCSCETNLGRIDLNMASKGSPYVYKGEKSSDTYYWQPCSDFTKYSVTAGAIQTDITSRSSVLGLHNLTSTGAVDGFARFSMGTPNKFRSTHVICVCGSGDIFVFDKEEPLWNYNFKFTSEACCPRKSELGGRGLSVGSISVIIFVLLIVAYCVTGTIIQVVVRKAQGRERFPNITLWAALPGLIRDGFIFTCTCGRSRLYAQI